MDLAVCILASLPINDTTAMKNKISFRSRTLRTQFSELKNDSPLSLMIYDTAEEWYKAKHPRFSFDEVALVNSLDASSCPHCGSSRFKRDGKRKDGIQNFRCNDCGRKFNPLSGTLFDSRKIPISEWIEFLIHIFQYESCKVSSLDNRNAQSTGRYWLKKVFTVLKDYQSSVVVGERFWLDETYLSKKPSDTSEDEEGRKLRGLSHDKICIATATDGTHSILFPIGNGKPSSKRVIGAMEGHISKNATMVDDGEKAHAILVRTYSLNREMHPSDETKGLDDDDNPMNTVNALHRSFKTFMSRHGSYDRDGLIDWCNLFSFIYNHNGKVVEMVKEFLDMAIKTKEIIRYRAVISKK